MPRDDQTRTVIDEGWVEAREAACGRLIRKEVPPKVGIDEGDTW